MTLLSFEQLGPELLGRASASGTGVWVWYPHRGHAQDFLKQALAPFLLHSYPAYGYFCSLLIIFANILDLDQTRLFVGPDLDPNCLTL